MSREDITLEAVIIFADGKIDRELQYPEFEAIIDGFVPIPEFAGRRMEAVYLRVNPSFRITSCVFFLVDFDAKGMIASGWNVPMQSLADNAARGPDLGAGPVALACYSQCPIQWQQRNLWDPVMEPGRNSFVLMKKAIVVNTLGLLFPKQDEEPEASPEADHRELRDALERQYAQTMRTRLAHTLKEQRLRINTLKSRMALKLDALKREHQVRLESYNLRLQQADDAVAAADERIKTLQSELALQTGKVEGLKEYYEHKLAAARESDEPDADLEALELDFADRLEREVESVRAELQQQLDMREMELHYRQQQEASLRDEIEHLQSNYASLLKHGATQVLLPMEKAGISFVVHAPGCGQLSLSVSDVSDYMSDPEAFAASKCGLGLALYKQWLDHYRSPYCTACDEANEECGTGVNRVHNPADFHHGESNRCPEHRHSVAAKVSARPL
ncbi:hypothetical protein [Gilvimarinus xylanilyticus]|uniref:Chromosome partitioning protein ParA n=1 Tax=Gilvimarinus xylanilyticus TaxID=2944139 RepID=A0A9X2I3Q9_9GAMM|nr:hypothetical protein [Gilvimarinus xylanilyticus]MCP8898397.1 hypothetical protein [Gilvimarinus xylanilyticus]